MSKRLSTFGRGLVTAVFDLPPRASIDVASTIGAFVYAAVVAALNLAEDITRSGPHYTTNASPDCGSQNGSGRCCTHDSASASADCGTLLSGRACGQRQTCDGENENFVHITLQDIIGG